MTDPRYPRGKIHPDDEGETGLRIFVDDATATVIVDFMKPVNWIGLSAADARAVAGLLNLAAAKIDGVPPS